MDFAGACPCHLDEYFRGEQVECKRKGRVLPLCYNFAMERLREGLAEVNAWTPAQHGGIQLWQLVQGAARGAFANGQARVKPYDNIPYLFSRLGEPGIKARVLDQFNRAPAHAHDDATMHVMSGQLRADFDAMADDGTNMTNALASEVSSD
eukprot:1500827-Pyramimonas_sp.AAC.1